MRYPLIPAHYILRDATVFQPDKTATDFYGAKITWDQLYHKVTRMANVLVENIKKGTEWVSASPTARKLLLLSGQF